jgi:hypothetical protein
MDKIIFAFALCLFSLVVEGQKDTLNSTSIYLSKPTFSGTVTWATKYGEPKNDTSKVLLLYCDTTYLTNSNFYAYKSDVNEIGVGNNYVPYVFWMQGYVVYKTVRVLNGMPPFDYESEFVGWLDTDKKPLPKNIVIWQSKSY